MCRLVIIFATIFIAVASATDFKGCEGQFSRTVPNAVRVKGCDKSPCPVDAGSNLEIEVDFIAPFKAYYLFLQATTIIGNVQYRLPVSHDVTNFCNDLLNSNHCPLNPGESGAYKLAFPIPTSLRGLDLDITVNVNDFFHTYNCFSVNVKVI